MKNTIFFFAIFTLLFLTFSCDKDNATPKFETVVNANGPAFIQVVNNRSETIEIYLGNFIPFGAELRKGRCEIYGVPAQNRMVEISSLDGTKSRSVQVDAKAGQTTIITVGASFF